MWRTFKHCSQVKVDRASCIRDKSKLFHASIEWVIEMRTYLKLRFSDERVNHHNKVNSNVHHSSESLLLLMLMLFFLCITYSTKPKSIPSYVFVRVSLPKCIYCCCFFLLSSTIDPMYRTLMMAYTRKNIKEKNNSASIRQEFYISYTI